MRAAAARARLVPLDRVDRLMARAAWVKAREVATGLLGMTTLTPPERARCHAVIAEVCSREKTKPENFRDPHRYVACLARAAAHWTEAYRLAPTPQVTADLAQHLWPFGDFPRQLALTEEALRGDPGNALWRTQRAEMLLVLGRWSEGFAEYEQRLLLPGFKTSVGLTAEIHSPVWDGSDLAGRSILVLQEGGYGDTLQMIRYARGLKDRFHAGQVIAQVVGPLVNLLKGMPELDSVVSVPEVPVADCHIPMMSLPHRFGTTVETPWAPYLDVPARTHPPLRVGLVWHGSTHNPGDMTRSILPSGTLVYPDLRTLVLSDLPVEWVCLQLGDARQIVANLPWGRKLQYPELAPEWTLARDVLATLDLVIGVETGIAHLSAAMGIPTWLLLGVSPAWRWLARGDRSPWYPSVRLFRARKLWDWSEPFAAVGKELQREVSP